MTASPSADLRAAAIGAVAWATALLCLRPPAAPWFVALLLVGLVLWAGPARVRPPLGWLLLVVAVALVTLLHAGGVESSGIEPLAADRASVRGTATVVSDPVTHRGRFGEHVSVRLRLSEVTGRGRQVQVRAPVLAFGDPAWSRVELGSRVRFAGRLDTAGSKDLSAVVAMRGPPTVVSRPDALHRAAGTLRRHIRAAARHGDSAAGALVPALVDGDDAGLSPEVQRDFRTTGLTHLLAVSGTNLTLVIGALLLLARAVGVRARGLLVVGILGVAGFVLLARAEPSVLRAAAMGSIALLGLGTDRTRRGLRLLGAAVTGLLLVDPWLAVSAGFALSVTATAGILVLVPGWTAALGRWLPTWLAQAVAVPLAAQLTCTPIVAAISGQVSLVAVAANLVVAPAIGPATVLGLLGGVVGLLVEDLGRLVALPAVACAGWVVWVAQACARLPVAALDWSTSVVALLLLTVGCVVLAVFLGDLLARPVPSMLGCVVLALGCVVPLPTPGWPPAGWVMVACDVGQGDAIVLHAGDGVALVVDAGGEPAYVDACLRRLQVRSVGLVVLSHFHADHVGGLPGVLQGREVGRIAVSPVADPLDANRRVRAQAAASKVPIEVFEAGDSGGLGRLRWQVLAPYRLDYPDSESPPNDGSLVLLVEVGGVRILLAGDQERVSQADLRRQVGELRADVLKVAHHGSSKQDADLIRGLGARLAVISAGRDNDYGHPAPDTLELLEDAGLLVARTDRRGDVAVVPREGRLAVVTRVPRNRPPPGAVGWS